MMAQHGPQVVGEAGVIMTSTTIPMMRAIDPTIATITKERAKARQERGVRTRTKRFRSRVPTSLEDGDFVLPRLSLCLVHF